MSKYILTIDQSTTATKAIIFDEYGKLKGRSNIAHKQIYPKSGWVEHDGQEIYQNTVDVMKQVIEKTGIDKKLVVAIALTNQRETTILWDKTGKPVYNAIVWQCSRGKDLIKEKKIADEADYIKQATGINISPYFSSSKAKWICDNVHVERGTLFGTIDSWLIWKLTGKHATDYSNASRTQLFNIAEKKWDEKLIDIFGLKDLDFPEVKYSDEIFGYTTVEGMFDEPIPVSGVMGDSHGALFGQKCFEKGTGKATFGTGASIMINIGDKPTQSQNGLVTSIAWGISGKVEYVFEGNINSSGDTIKWLCEGMDIMSDAKESEEMANQVEDSNGLYLVPAFHGLSAPHWDYDCKGLMCGIRRDTTKNHIARAGLESIGYQICDITQAVANDIGNPVDVINVDGGATNNTLLMQFVSDMIRANLVKAEIEELSAQGAMFAAGIAVGIFKDKAEIENLKSNYEIFEPKMNLEDRTKYYDGWKDALKRTMLK